MLILVKTEHSTFQLKVHSQVIKARPKSTSSSSTAYHWVLGRLLVCAQHTTTLPLLGLDKAEDGRGAGVDREGLADDGLEAVCLGVLAVSNESSKLWILW